MSKYFFKKQLTHYKVSEMTQEMMSLTITFLGDKVKEPRLNYRDMTFKIAYFLLCLYISYHVAGVPSEYLRTQE